MLVSFPYIGLVHRPKRTPWQRYEEDLKAARKGQKGHGVLGFFLAHLMRTGQLDWEHYQIHVLARLNRQRGLRLTGSQLEDFASRVERCLELLCVPWGLNSKGGGISGDDCGGFDATQGGAVMGIRDHQAGLLASPVAARHVRKRKRKSKRSKSRTDSPCRRSPTRSTGSTS